jgi:peroxiredoxin
MVREGNDHMRIQMVIAGACVLAGALVSALGCNQSPTPSSTTSAAQASGSKQAHYDVKVASAESKIAPPRDDSSPAATSQSDVGNPTAANGQLPLDDAPTELTMPQVFLTQAHADTCLVRVGDQFPDLRLADLQGQEQFLSRLMGEKLTVVAFWNGRRPTALVELADLGPCVVQRFLGQGVAVVGVNSGDDPRPAGELLKQAGATFANLSDRDGKALAQVATARLPRTYLLDASGKVVWFDLEYSRTTRRELVQAIRFLLAQK